MMSLEQIHPNPPEIQSFLANRILHADIAEFSKKRKSLDKQLSLPTRKLKFRDGSPGSEHSFVSVGDPEAENVPRTWMMNVNNNVSHEDVRSIQPHSEMDSNSFIEETSTDCALSLSTEVKSEPEVSKVCTHDKPANSKREFLEVYACDKPSTSSGSCGSNSSKDTLYTLDSRSFKKFRAREEEGEARFIEDQHLDSGYHTDYICSEKTIDEIEECMNVDSEEVVLYPSGASSELFVLSSGRWKINQDAQAGVRKPTIDQEFEQYFSMLML